MLPGQNNRGDIRKSSERLENLCMTSEGLNEVFEANFAELYIPGPRTQLYN